MKMKQINRRTFLSGSTVMVAGLALGGCGSSATPQAAPPVAKSGAEASKPFDPDKETDSLDYANLAKNFGAVPAASKKYRVGGIVKFLGNQYWQIMATGMHDQAQKLGVSLDVQGSTTESDREGQVVAMQSMIDKKYDAILVSPQTNDNLIAMVEKARQAGILVVNLADAVLSDAEYWAGPNQYQNGVSVANFFKSKFPEGGNVAVIEGQPGVYAAQERTKAFNDTLAGSNIKVVASVSGYWDLQKALDATTKILTEQPDVKAFYCNNDIMALGTVEAINRVKKLDKILVVGTDGIQPAYDSIRAKEMTATVDIFPYDTGQVGVEVVLRLLEGQKLPRAVYSPQNLVTLDNIDHPHP